MKLENALELFYKSMQTVKKDSTIRWYHGRLDPFVAFFQDREVESIDLFDLEAFRSTLDRPSMAPGRNGNITNQTIHGYVRAIRTFFNWMKKRKIIKENPAEDLEKPRLPKQPRKGIAPDAQKKMISESKTNVRDYAIFLFMHDTACRAGGVYNLLTENLDLRHNRAVIREKGDKERTVFYTPAATLALTMYAASRENPKHSDHFFLSLTTHEPLQYSGIYQIYRRAAKKAGVTDKFSPHQWRHATIRGLIEAGMNLKTVSEFAGHEGVEVTGDIYGTLNEKEIQEVYNRNMAILYDDPDYKYLQFNL